MGRSLQVEVRPTVWSLCMWDRKNSRVPGHLRTCQKSTASGVCGMTLPFTDMVYVFTGGAATSRTAEAGEHIFHLHSCVRNPSIQPSIQPSIDTSIHSSTVHPPILSLSSKGLRGRLSRSHLTPDGRGHTLDRYKRVVTPRRAGLAVLICWTVAFIVGLTPMLGWNNLRRLQQNGSISSDLIITCQFENVISMDYMVYFNFFGWVLPPLVLMLVIYAEIFYMIHKQLNSKKFTTSHTDPNKYYDKELNLAKSLALVLFLFAISWLPLHIINCITLFCPECNKPIVLLYIAILLTHGNSAVNPIVYAFRIKKFRTAFKKIWQQYFCCKDTPALEIQPSDRKEMPNPEPQQVTPPHPPQKKILNSDPTQQQPPPPEQQQDQMSEAEQQPKEHPPLLEQNRV